MAASMGSIRRPRRGSTTSLIGTRFKIVNGYSSTSQIALAIERGEVQGIADWSWSSLKAVRPQWLADKRVTAAAAGRAEERAGARLAAERAGLHQERRRPEGAGIALHQKTAARPLIAPPEVPAERVALLRQAFEALARDQEFLAEMDKAKMEFNFVPGYVIDKVVAQVAATPPEIAERYAKAFAADPK